MGDTPETELGSFTEQVPASEDTGTASKYVPLEEVPSLGSVRSTNVDDYVNLRNASALSTEEISILKMLFFKVSSLIFEVRYFSFSQTDRLKNMAYRLTITALRTMM